MNYKEKQKMYRKRAKAVHMFHVSKTWVLEDGVIKFNKGVTYRKEK